MTGRYYWRTSVKDGKVLPINAPLHIETNRLTLASLCKQQGYNTAAFGKWHLGMTNERVSDWSMALKPGPLEIGFDYFFGMAANIGNGPHSFIENHAVTNAIPGQAIIASGGVDSDSPTTGIRQSWTSNHIMETLTTHVCSWIHDNRKRQPFFLYFAPNAVHEPIVPNPNFTGNKLGKYGDFIRELDWSVGQVLEALDKNDLAEDTLIIFSSDNGGVVNPGNESASTAMRAGLAINGPLRGGKHTEWEGGFREPFIVRWPGKVPAGSTSDQVVCLSDMLATFAALLGAPLPKGSAEDSFNVLSCFTERGSKPREPLVLQSAGAVYDIRIGDWKLVERADTPEFESVRNPRKAQRQANQRQASAQKPDELYNLREDPTEGHDVATSNTQRVAEMKAALRAARERGFTRQGALDDPTSAPR
jgi:arylsulfatase A-like enzyme